VSEANSLLKGIQLRSASPAQIEVNKKLADRIAGLKHQNTNVHSNVSHSDASVRGPIKDITTQRQFRTIPEGSIIGQDVFAPIPGVSFVAACMNREDNLFKVLPSWLETDVDEIIIVDWSSKNPIQGKLREFSDRRVKLLRVEGERYWILTHALNVGLRCASHEYIFKLDCDIRVSQDFIHKNKTTRREFVRGFWKTAVDAGQDDQRYVNGTFGAHKDDLRGIGYYDERIQSYGWDDTDIYQRLSGDLGLAGRLLDQGSVWHIEQSEVQRLENQNAYDRKFLAKFERTEYEAAKNKFYTIMSGAWGKWSDAHDYHLSQAAESVYTTRRASSVKQQDAGLIDLAQILAVRQLLSWTADISKVFTPEARSGTALYKLFRDAHLRGASQQLHTALSVRAGVHFVKVESATLLGAVKKTLQVIASHQPNFANHIVLLATNSDVEFDTTQSDDANIYYCPNDLVERLGQQCAAEEITNLDELEQLFGRDSAEKCRVLNLSIDLICSTSISKAEALAQKLGRAFQEPSELAVGVCMVTSLYDESNVIRLTEYVACVVGNIRVFERVVILYESRTGLLFDIVRQLEQLLALDIGRLLIIPYKDRPSFSELFSVQQCLPAGTVLAAANADIVFDGTLSKLSQLELSDKVVVLSRRDISAGGTSATLIRLPNGAPNTFSADAWMVKTPFAPDFFLDYKIGTFHCDSFINNQLSRSTRYRAVNLCFDIHAFHLHDERFNSSAEKHTRDTVEIQAAYGREYTRNDSQDPIRGLAWSTIAAAQVESPAMNFQRWAPKTLFIDLTESTANFGHLIGVHILVTLAAQLGDVSTCIRLRQSDISNLGGYFGKYNAAFPTIGFLLDVDDQVLDPKTYTSEKIRIRTRSFSALVDLTVKSGIGDVISEVQQLLAWPSGEGVDLLRTVVAGGLDQCQVHHFWSLMQAGDNPLARTFVSFLNSLPRYSVEERLVAPFIYGEQLGPRYRPPFGTLRRDKPKVSFVTSLFRGGDFLPGFLENVAFAALESDGEVIIFDANPDEEDEAVIKQFLRANSGLATLFQYRRAQPDPGLYGCWRLGIEMARAPYVTNANVDDRRSPSHTLKLARALDLNPTLAGACGSIACVRSGGQSAWYSLDPKEIWFHGDSIREFSKEGLFSADAAGNIISRNIMHCMPLWRKALHDRYGYFDEELYGTSADWAFWLKCASFGERFTFDQSAFGQYFLNPNSHNRRNDADGRKEARIIADYFHIDQQVITKQ
jgi:hypothetical protein